MAALLAASAHAAPADLTLRPQLERIAAGRVFFGHQSVGNNVIAGLRELADSARVPLRIAEVKGGAPMAARTFSHAFVADNGDPHRKLRSFEQALEAQPPANFPDVAMLKFCYVDVKGNTDPVALFERYRAEIDALRKARPGVVIVHVTMPLWVDTGIIDHIGTIILGKATPIRALNASRHRYNELLRQDYEGKEPFFDLAAYEATRADGTVTDVRYQGRRIPSLAKEWTTDGGHLNEAARLRLAEVFLVMLAKIP